MRLRTIVGAAALGGALSYFLDPDQGNRRRSVARDRVLAAFRRGGREAAGMAQGAAAQAQGAAQRAAAAARPEQPPPNDETLAHKVETNIFRDADVPKGKINVNAVDGVVTLRGEVDDPALIERLEAETRNIAGVRAVENLLHTPGTPAPHSEASPAGASSGE
jgi:hypothetical protein